jgi:hypothetical protein
VLLALAVLQALVAVYAAWGGMSLALGARGFALPVEWLRPVGLRSWVLPGVALVVVVGGTSALGAVASWVGHRWAVPASMLSGGVLLAWLALQLAVIGPRAPVQAVTGAAGLAVLLLAAWATRAARHHSPAG